MLEQPQNRGVQPHVGQTGPQIEPSTSSQNRFAAMSAEQRVLRLYDEKYRINHGKTGRRLSSKTAGPIDRFKKEVVTILNAGGPFAKVDGMGEKGVEGLLGIKERGKVFHDALWSISHPKRLPDEPSLGANIVAWAPVLPFFVHDVPRVWESSISAQSAHHTYEKIPYLVAAVAELPRIVIPTPFSGRSLDQPLQKYRSAVFQLLAEKTRETVSTYKDGPVSQVQETFFELLDDNLRNDRPLVVGIYNTERQMIYAARHRAGHALINPEETAIPFLI